MPEQTASDATAVQWPAIARLFTNVKITIHCRPEQSLLEMASQLRGMGYCITYRTDGIHAMPDPEHRTETSTNVVPLRKPGGNPFLGGAA